MNYDNYYKKGGMTQEELVSSIALRIGARKPAVAEFVEKNKIDADDLNSDLKSGKVYFMDVITAIVGKPDNRYQKEIIKKYGSKMAHGGEVNTRESNKKIKDWYVKTYPTDDLGKEINDDITFKSFYTYLSQGYDAYDTLGVYDSLVRENVFEKLAEIYGVDYDVIYNMWMRDYKYAEGGKTQGYDDREDERLSMEYGKIHDKDFVGSHEMREHSRRDDARFEERMARGGYVSKGELVWKKLTSSEKMKFLHENFTPEITPRSQETLVGKDYNFLPKNVKIVLESKYANVENYAKGGITREGEELTHYEPYFEKNVTVARINEDEKIVRPSHGYFYPNKIGKKTILWAKKNGYRFIQDGKEYAKGGYMADGGVLENLKRGDKVLLKDGNSTREAIVVQDGLDNRRRVRVRPDRFPMDMSVFIDPSPNEPIYVIKKLSEGGMMADGGETERDKNGMLYALTEHVSSGEIANITNTSKYSDIDEIRSKAIKYYIDNGDKPYSYAELESVLKKVNHTKYSKGGSIENQYEGRSAKDIWESWNQVQKIHFLVDHKQHPYYNMGDEKFVVTMDDRKKYVSMDYDELPKMVKLMISDHVQDGEYAKGGDIEDSLPAQNKLNKKVLKEIDKEDIFTKLEMGQVVVSALTDANFHSETRKFISILENKPEWAKEPKLDYSLPFEKFQEARSKTVYSSKYYDAPDEIKNIGINIANDSAWEFIPLVESLKYASQMKGLHKIADALDKLNLSENPKNDWKYTDVDDIEYVIVKDKNGKELRFAGKYVLSGVHDLLAKGGKLSDEGKYYSKNNVVAVISGGKNIIDKNTVSGVWIMKNAKPMDEDVVDMKIGKTTIKKGHNGWVGKTMIDNFKGYDWDITTIKNYNGDLVTTAQGGKTKKEDGYSMFTFMMFQDPNIRLKSSRPARVTDKVVTEQHEEAIKYFKDNADLIAEQVDKIQAKKKMADGGAIGFDALAKKVAKNYEGDKVKKQYQKEYGKTYDKVEAEEVGKKVAAKVYRQQQSKNGKMEKGGKTSSYNRSESKMSKIAKKASEIRKPNEAWKDAFNRAKAMIS